MHLVAPLGPPVRRIEQVAPVSVSKSPSGRTMVDFGQNPSADCASKLRVRPVTRSRCVTRKYWNMASLAYDRFALLKQRTATLCEEESRNMGTALYVPWLPLCGSRNWPGELNLQDLSAVVCHSDLERTGWFECSDPLLNHLHQNVVWGIRGNFLDVPQTAHSGMNASAGQGTCKYSPRLHPSSMMSAGFSNPGSEIWKRISVNRAGACRM